MIAARATPAVQGVAEALPFADDGFDAAMAVLTVHHWRDWRAGAAELRRVARGRVVMLTWDSAHTHDLWLVEYLPELADNDRALFPRPGELLETLGGGEMRTVPISHDCLRRVLRRLLAAPGALPRSGRPAGHLRPGQLDPAVRERGLERARARPRGRRPGPARHADLAERTELDLGYRLVIASP